MSTWTKKIGCFCVFRISGHPNQPPDDKTIGHRATNLCKIDSVLWNCCNDQMQQNWHWTIRYLFITSTRSQTSLRAQWLSVGLPVCGMLSIHPCRFYIFCAETNCPQKGTKCWRWVAGLNNSLSCSCPGQVGIIVVHFFVHKVGHDSIHKQRHIHSIYK